MSGQRQAEARLRSRQHAEIAHDDPGRHGRKHPRSADPLGDQERAERGDRGHRGFDDVIVRGPGDRHGPEADDEPDRDAAACDLDQRRDDPEGAAGSRRAMRGPGEDQGEEDRRRAIVDEAFGLDEEPQASRDPGLAQKRDHRDRVGGGDERPERQRRLDPPTEDINQRARHDRSAEEHPDRGKTENRDEVAPQIDPANVQRRFEQQRRQDDVEDEVVRQREAGADTEKGQRRPGEDEPDGVGQPQPPRGEGDENGQSEKAEGAKQQDVHGDVSIRAGLRGKPRARRSKLRCV